MPYSYELDFDFELSATMEEAKSDTFRRNIWRRYSRNDALIRIWTAKTGHERILADQEPLLEEANLLVQEAPKILHLLQDPKSLYTKVQFEVQVCNPFNSKNVRVESRFSHLRSAVANLAISKQPPHLVAEMQTMAKAHLRLFEEEAACWNRMVQYTKQQIEKYKELYESRTKDDTGLLAAGEEALKDIVEGQLMNPY